jgi:hypothetical protein
LRGSEILCSYSDEWKGKLLQWQGSITCQSRSQVTYFIAFLGKIASTYHIAQETLYSEFLASTINYT